MRRVLAESGRDRLDPLLLRRSSPETLAPARPDRLAERYPGARVVGMKSPPFRPLTPEEDAADLAAINAARPDFSVGGAGRAQAGALDGRPRAARSRR